MANAGGRTGTVVVTGLGVAATKPFGVREIVTDVSDSDSDVGVTVDGLSEVGLVGCLG
jgi:hypothetical protein